MGSYTIMNRDSLGTCDEGDDFCDGDIDPRVKDYLDTLNSTSSDINHLETELDMARNKFRRLLNESTHKLNVTYEDLGKCVAKSRQYYVLLTQSKQAQAEAHDAAVQFQHANQIYQVARETVALAEERIITDDGQSLKFDSAWQEMLNHATQRFTEAEKDRTDSEDCHLERASEYATIQGQLKTLEKESPRSIVKSRPYFDLKDRLEYGLKQERRNVDDLQRTLTSAKDKYRDALGSLEAISNEIHRQRKANALPARTPGVGAESYADGGDGQTELPATSLDVISETSSGVYVDDDAISLDSLCLVAGRAPAAPLDPDHAGSHPPLRRQPTGVSAVDSDDGAGADDAGGIADDGVGADDAGAATGWCIGSEAIPGVSDDAGRRVEGGTTGDGTAARETTEGGTTGDGTADAVRSVSAAGSGNQRTTTYADVAMSSCASTDGETARVADSRASTNGIADAVSVDDGSRVDRVVASGEMKSSTTSEDVSDDVDRETDMVQVARAAIRTSGVGDVDAAKVESNAFGVAKVESNAGAGEVTVGADGSEAGRGALVPPPPPPGGSTGRSRRDRSLRNAQFPILVGLAECNRRTSPQPSRRGTEERAGGQSGSYRGASSATEADDGTEIFV